MLSRHLLGVLAAAVALAAYSDALSASNEAPEVRPSVQAAYGHARENVVVTAYISGPSTIVSGGTHTWRVYASGGSGVYSYQWQYREDNSTTWVNVGSDLSRYTRFVPNADPSFALRVIVTDGSESVTTDEFEVYHEQDPAELTR